MQKTIIRVAGVDYVIHAKDLVTLRGMHFTQDGRKVKGKEAAMVADAVRRGRESARQNRLARWPQSMSARPSRRV